MPVPIPVLHNATPIGLHKRAASITATRPFASPKNKAKKPLIKPIIIN